MSVFSRIRSWLPLDSEQRRLGQLKNEIEGKPKKKRKPFDAKVAVAWWSPSRFRNQFIMAIAAVVYMYSDGLWFIKKGIFYDLRLRADKREFLKQLDEEDRLFEEELAASGGSKAN